MNRAEGLLLPLSAGALRWGVFLVKLADGQDAAGHLQGGVFACR